MFCVNNVSKKIVTLRKERNLTQTELADRLGVSFQAVSNWERGNSMPDISKLPQLAEVFGCSVDEILEEKSEILDSAMKDTLQDYVENNDISSEELETVIPVLKPEQVDTIANGILLKNGDNIDIFYPFLDNDTLRELAEQKRAKGESIQSMLPFLGREYLRELALGEYEKGAKISTFYPFLDRDTLRELAERKRAKGEPIQSMLPFLGREYLRELALGEYEKGAKISMFYPFLDNDTLKDLAKQKIGKGESIQSMLPFLGNDFLRKLVLG